MKDKFAVSMFGQKRLSREGGIEIVVKELCTRMARDGCRVTCYNRSGHHVSGAEYDNKIEYDGIRQKFVPTIEGKGLAAVSSSFFAALYSAFGKYDVVHIHAEGPAFFSWLPKMFGKRVVVTIHGIDWQREKWKSGFGSKFIRQGEKNAVKYADEIIVLSKGVQDYFRDTYGRETHFVPNGVNRPETREAGLITEKFGLTKDSYILFLGRLVPEKGIRYLVEAFKAVKVEGFLLFKKLHRNVAVRFNTRERQIFFHAQFLVIPENAIVCEGKTAAVNMTKERMIVLIELSIALGRHSRVTHDYVDVMWQVNFHLSSGQRALINTHAAIEVVRNTSRVCAAHLAFTR